MNYTIYLSLGSNLGNRLLNLETAIQYLHPEIEIIKRSSVYETPPWGYEDQPPFLNMVIVGQTMYSPGKLLKFLKSIEKEMGRMASFRFGPRLIDLDILFYDQLILESEELVIPHPRISERAFVLVPMAEIAPDLIHPKLDQRIKDLLDKLDTWGIEKYEASSDDPTGSNE
ncbi:2-amino-4-hydroxy-6-hydroxymethyldihydropteridine diphosphokinase [Chloroflexota bacterium]